MRISGFACGLPILSCLSGAPALACIVPVPLQLEDIKFADVVAVGTIENYEIVLDESARDRRKKMLENLPEDTDPEFKKILEEQDGFMSDYARFDLRVDELLLGEAPATISVFWDNSSFGEPDKMTDGSVLIALVEPGKSLQLTSGFSPAILSHPDNQSLSVLQALCSGAFIFQSTSAKADEVRALLLPK
jgi:hypothetical protein